MKVVVIALHDTMPCTDPCTDPCTAQLAQLAQLARQPKPKSLPSGTSTHPDYTILLLY